MIKIEHDDDENGFIVSISATAGVLLIMRVLCPTVVIIGIRMLV